MDNQVYESLVRYFTMLSIYGYKSYQEVYKVLVLLFINELINNDFYGIMTEADYRDMENAVSNLEGRSCLLPYQNYCKNAGSGLYCGSLTEMAYRVSQLENLVATVDSTVVENVTDINP